MASNPPESQGRKPRKQRRSERPADTSGRPGSPALDWAVEAFRIDPGARGDRQGGVRELQNWLNSNGAKVAPDGLLGPATLAALERIYATQQTSQATQETTGETVLKAAGLSEAEQKAAEEKLRQSFEEPLEDEPGTTPEPDDGDGVRDEPGEDEEATATARPVALSDSAIEDIAQDRLGFTPYVEAVADFILAEQTRPPLALAINARWGQGKTSFMNMLDGELKAKARDTTVRVATTWFNPWKYSEPEQVWAAFIANVSRCLQNNLTPPQRRHFQWDRFKQKWQRHADLAFVIRLLVLVAFLVLVFGTAATMKWSEIGAWSTQGDSFLAAFYKAISTSLASPWGYLLLGPFAVLAILYGYISFTKDLGLNLLEYVEKTDFKDKIGTISQFESEMRRLADAVPADLKVVVFIDDLDRCKGQVLGEIIEALQLADVSRTCIFVMGMDLQIVARAVESERSELTKSTGGIAHMEHGSGYKFLEKIIQARLSLPSHGQPELARLVASAMEPEAEGSDQSGENAPEARPAKAPIEETAAFLRGAWKETDRPAPPPKDSDALIRTAEYFGSRHFSNPRRLKRFINGFRLQAYLAAAVRPDATEVERLARFLVLAEKWPALLHYLVTANKGAEFLEDEQSMGTYYGMAEQVRNLRDADRKRVVELLHGRGGNDPLTAGQIQSLAAWCGFFYYPGIEAKTDAG